MATRDGNRTAREEPGPVVAARKAGGDAPPPPSRPADANLLQSVRIDLWLDVACLFRTRSEAQRAAKGGKVEINGRRAKPHREIRPGDELRITRSNGVTQVVSVAALAEHHLPKSAARRLYEDRTPPPTEEELALRMLLRRAGRAAAPDKQQRRQLRRLKGRGRDGAP